MTTLDEAFEQFTKVQEGKIRIPTVPAPMHISYQDSLGVWTIGYGFNLEDETAKSSLKDVTNKKIEDLIARDAFLTEEEAQSLLSRRMATTKAETRRIVPSFDKLSDERKFVIFAWGYQLGASRLKKFKKTLAAIGAGDFELASDEMLRSRWAKQTKRRANALSSSMKTGTYPQSALGSAGSAPSNPPPSSPAAAPPQAQVVPQAPTPAGRSDIGGPSGQGDMKATFGPKGGDAGGTEHRGGTIIFNIRTGKMTHQ